MCQAIMNMDDHTRGMHPVWLSVYMTWISLSVCVQSQVVGGGILYRYEVETLLTWKTLCIEMIEVLTFEFLGSSKQELVEYVEGPLVWSLTDNPGFLQQVRF